MTAAIKSEAQCIELVKRGDSEAYSYMVKKYMKKAYYIAFSYLKNEADALDTSQDAFIKAFRHVKKFKTGHNFFPWFYQVLKNLCFDRLRKNKKKDEIPLEDLKLAAAPQPDELLKIELWRGIEALPLEPREILTLRYFHGFSYREIAQLLDKPMGSVMSSLYYAKKKLKEKMGDFLNESRKN